MARRKLRRGLRVESVDGFSGVLHIASSDFFLTCFVLFYLHRVVGVEKSRSVYMGSGVELSEAFG